MTVYRINIRHQGQLLGHVESATPWSLQAARQVAATLDAAGG